MSSPALSEGWGMLTGFTKLCKGLAVVLVAAHILVHLFPPAVTYLALIPARTIPFAWNLLTAGYFEQTIYGVVISVSALLFLGKILEPIWGCKEFVKFIFVVNSLTYICVFTTAIALYYATRVEAYLYVPISGFHGVLSGFLVGIKQIIPQQELSLFGIAKLKAKWLPSIMILLSVIASFFSEDSAAYLPMLICGTYMSWIYLRYLQRRSETSFSGDPSDEFAFVTFFPEFLRPVIGPISTIFHWMFCGRSEASNQASDCELGGTPLPGSKTFEASTRRASRRLSKALHKQKSQYPSEHVPIVSSRARFTFFFVIAFAAVMLASVYRLNTDSTAPKNATTSKNAIKWALLVAGSTGMKNYRHQADVCHAYQILRQGGLRDEHIIVFMYDDIAFHERNPYQGIIINSFDGFNVYPGVPKDYTGENLTLANFFAVLLGDRTAIRGGSGKVLNSSADDNIFIYFSGHGGYGHLFMADHTELYVDSFIRALETKHQSRTYRNMVIYVESCLSGSMFRGLRNTLSIYAMTASDMDENSLAKDCVSHELCFGNRFSQAWMYDIESHDTSNRTLEEHYEVVRELTIINSWVGRYGDRRLAGYYLSEFFGFSPPQMSYVQFLSFPRVINSTVDQYEASIFYLQQQVYRAPEGSIQREEAQQELDAELSTQKKIDKIFKELRLSFFGDSQPQLDDDWDDWDCFRALVKIHETYCGPLSQYGLKHTKIFAHLCSAGVGFLHFTRIVSQVCRY